MSKDIKFVLAPPETIREYFYKDYHWDKTDFDYDSLDEHEKYVEDITRTAFFAGFHAAEKFYELQELIDWSNKDEEYKQFVRDNK